MLRSSTPWTSIAARSLIPFLVSAAIALWGTQAKAQVAGEVGAVLAASRVDDCYQNPGEVCILAEALALAREIDDVQSRIHRLLEAAEVMAKGREKARARQAFEQARHLIRAIKNNDDRQRALVELAGSHALSGDTAAAHATAREIPGTKRAEALLRIAETSAEKGNAGEAQRSLTAIRGLARAARIDDLVRIAKVQVSIDDMRGARDTLARAEELWSRSVLSSWGMLARIAALQFKAAAQTDARRNLDAAIRGLETGEKSSLLGWELSDLAKAQAEMGDPPAALETISRIAAPQRVGAFASLARVFARAGNLDAVDRALGEMLKVSGELSDAPQQDGARRWGAYLRAETGRPDAALKDARAVKNAALRAFSLADVARALAKLGRKAEGRAAIIEGLDAIRDIAGTFPLPSTHAEARMLGLVALGQAAQELGL